MLCTKRGPDHIGTTEERPLKRAKTRESSMGILGNLLPPSLMNRFSGIVLASPSDQSRSVPTEEYTPLQEVKQSSSKELSNVSSQPRSIPSIPKRVESKPIFQSNRREATMHKERNKILKLSAQEQEYQKLLATGAYSDSYESFQQFKSYAYLVQRAHKALSQQFLGPSKSRNKDSTILEELKRVHPTHSFENVIRNASSSLHSPKPLLPTLPAVEKLSLKSRSTDKQIADKRLGRRLFRKELEPDQQAFVKEMLTRDGVLSTMPGAEVASKDMRKLKPGVWLNDEVINFYMIMINNRSITRQQEAKKLSELMIQDENVSNVSNGVIKKKKQKIKQGEEVLNVHAFTSFFFNKLKTTGYTGVRRWTKKIDVFEKDAILMPINLYDAHWVSACINLRLRRFEFYDSMGAWNDNIIQALRQWLIDEHSDKKKKPIDLSEWTDYEDSITPQQSNGFDCGVVRSVYFVYGATIDYSQFTSQMMECCSRKNAALDFAQENMPYLRQKMVYEIGKQQFLEEEWS